MSINKRHSTYPTISDIKFFMKICEQTNSENFKSLKKIKTLIFEGSFVAFFQGS